MKSLRASGLPSFSPPVRALDAMDATALERDAVQFARLAVQRDQEGRYSEAVFYYKVGRRTAALSERPGGGSRCGGSQACWALLLLFPALLLSFSGERRPGSCGGGEVWSRFGSHHFSGYSLEWQMSTAELLRTAVVRYG